MKSDSKIFVAGHKGLVGSAIVRGLEAQGFKNILVRDRKDVDLENAASVEAFFATEKPEFVFMAAAKVGGILANDTYPVDFLRKNLLIQANVIESAYRNGCRKFEFLGSSCIYPKFAPQPMKEEHLLTGSLEPTNEWYAIAKIAGIKLCQAYRKQYGFDAISLMPTNMYGPGDNFELQGSHVLPALIRKFHEAKKNGSKEVVMWGTGTPKREFLHVDDLAEACIFLMQTYSDAEIVNVGSGTDVTIRELAEMVRETVGFGGEIVLDTTKPDGTPRKLMDVSRLEKAGWKSKIALREGIETTYRWFLENQGTFRA